MQSTKELSEDIYYGQKTWDRIDEDEDYHALGIGFEPFFFNISVELTSRKTATGMLYLLKEQMRVNICAKYIVIY